LDVPDGHTHTQYHTGWLEVFGTVCECGEPVLKWTGKNDGDYMRRYIPPRAFPTPVIDNVSVGRAT